MKSNELLKIFSAGVLKENPVFVLFLGMCPALGVTSSVINGIGMGIGVIFVLILSNVIISLIRNVVMDEIRIPVFIVIIATLVTILQMFMQAYTAELYNSMKVFIPNSIWLHKNVVRAKIRAAFIVLRLKGWYPNLKLP